MSDSSDLRTLRVLARLPPRLLRAGRERPRLPVAVRTYIRQASRAELQLMLISVVAKLERPRGRRRGS